MIRKKVTRLFESVESIPISYLNESGRLRIGDLIEDLNYVDDEVKLLETAGLSFEIWDAGKSKVGATINGLKYEYTPKGEVTVNDLWRVVKGIQKHSDGKALAWLRKNATFTRLSESFRSNHLKESKLNESKGWLFDKGNEWTLYNNSGYSLANVFKWSKGKGYGIVIYNPGWTTSNTTGATYFKDKEGIDHWDSLAQAKAIAERNIKSKLNESKEIEVVIIDPEKFKSMLKKSNILNENEREDYLRNSEEYDNYAAIIGPVSDAVDNKENGINSISDIVKGKNIKIPYITLGVLLGHLQDWGMKKK